MKKLSTVLALSLLVLSSCWKDYEIPAPALGTGECSYEGSGFTTEATARAEAERLSTIINGATIAGEKTYVIGYDVWDKYHAKKGQKDRIEGYAFQLKFLCGALAFKYESHSYSYESARDSAYNKRKTELTANSLNVLIQDSKDSTSSETCQICKSPRYRDDETYYVEENCNCETSYSYSYTLAWVEKNPSNARQGHVINQLQALHLLADPFGRESNQKLSDSLRAALRVLPENTDEYRASRDTLRLLEKAEARPLPRFRKKNGLK